MGYFILGLIVSAFWYNWKGQNSKKEKNSKPESSQTDQVNPFEVYKKINLMRQREKEGEEFDLELYGIYKRQMNDPSSIKIAEDIINSKNVYEAFDWYNEQKMNKFYFKDETYELMKKRINKEFDFNSLDLVDCHIYLAKIKLNCNIYLDEEKYNNALKKNL